MAKIIGYGTTVKCATNTTTTGSSVMTAVGHLISWGGGDAPVPKVDTSNINDAEETCEPGQPGAGELSFVVGYTQGDAGHQALIKMRKNRTKGLVRVISSTGQEETIKCFVSNVGLPGFDKTNRWTRSVSIQPTSGIGWSTA